MPPGLPIANLVIYAGFCNCSFSYTILSNYTAYLENLLDVESNRVMTHFVVKERVIELLSHTSSIEALQTQVNAIF